MKFQTLCLILLLVFLGEFIQTRDAHKSIRPHRYYRPRPRGHKPRWPRFPQTRYRHFRKGPPKPHYRPANGPRYGPRCPTDHVSDEQSYTIEIELPKRLPDSTRSNDNYHRIHIRKDADELSDGDYLEEDDEFEERVLQTGKKKVRIKVAKGDKPKLRIKISRNDNLTEVTDFVASPIRGPGLPRDSSVSLKKLGQMVHGEWMPGNPAPSFPVALRGA